MAKNNHQFDTIEAADITLAQTQSEVTPKESTRLKPLSVYIIGILCLLLIALAIIFTSYYRGSPASPTADNDKERSAIPAPALPAEQEVAQKAAQEAARERTTDEPFKRQQLATQRRAAQDILASVMEKQRVLESRQVSQWAGEDYKSALAAAEEGDLLYRQQDFIQAQQKYQSSDTLLTDIEARIPPLIADSLAAGNNAINAGEATQAKTFFNLVLAIEPDNEAAKLGLLRVETLPQVIDLVAAANDKLASSDPTAALASFQQALKIDPEYQPAVSGAASTKEQISNAAFQNAMDHGYQQLQGSNYAAAANAFRRALSVDPNSNAANQALAQAQNELGQSQVRALLSVAINHEQQEQWLEAVATYNKVLAIDNSVVTATVGKIRSQTRATLDSKLKSMIAAPLRLSSPGVHKQAKQLLVDARQIQPGGSRLTQQINQLQQLLIFANTPQPVTLISDNTTAVTVLRVGNFGEFTEKTIKLKPGKYVAEGVRIGYRDVRIDFVVGGKVVGGKNDSGSAMLIQIACRDAI
ncbi:MAG: hypothetical protein DRR42_14270 [Gammaproteobacteria bacterium]|nr:MAG: hypothetical protein DRR42_14270 [Gammaproteobacteria bacterium]